MAHHEITESMSRLGIYFFFDPDGVVDDYVVTFLEDMRANLTELVIVSNGDLSEEALARLLPFTERIIMRENRGFDVWAYRDALASLGWQKLAGFDEVILMNSTIMGPVYPFAEMFAEMDTRDADFWGITAYHGVDWDPFGLIPEGKIPWHIQSHFMAFRRSLVNSKAFQDYWDNVPEITRYEEAVALHEAVFTKKFQELGFKADVYVDTADLEDFTYYPLSVAPLELVGNRKSPIFKRRSFFANYHDLLNAGVGASARDLYDYLRDSTSFDTDLIWQNALRTMNMADIVRNLHLNYVLPTDARQCTPDSKRPRLALVVHVYYVDLFGSMLRYIASMPPDAAVIITTDTQDKADQLAELSAGLANDVEIRLVENRGRDVSALLIGARDVLERFDLVCFIHDKKVTQIQPLSVGAGFAEKCFENLLPTPDFVENVVSLFAREPRLGMVMPTPPNHASYFTTHFQGWGPNFDATVELLESLGVRVPLSPDKPPISPLGTMFWFRPKAMASLLEREWVYEDFPAEPNEIDGTLLHAIERAYSYVGQSLGYYSGWLFSDRFASVELTNLDYQVKELVAAAVNTVALSDLVGMASQLRNTPSLTEFNAQAERMVQLENDLYQARLDGSVRHKVKQVVKKVLPASARPRIRKAVNLLKGIE